MSDDALPADPDQTHGSGHTPKADDVRDAGRGDDAMWTAPTLDTYLSKVADLRLALTEHADLVSTRVGRQQELAAYFASAALLQQAVNAFAEAEYDWCGSFPVRGDDVDEDVLDDEEVGGISADEASQQSAGVVTVLGRYDYVITDAAAVVDHGRSAYLQHWEQESAQDAEHRVQGPADALREVLHGAPLAELEGVPGLQLSMWVSEFIHHEGSDEEEEVAQDPFGIVRRG